MYQSLKEYFEPNGAAPVVPEPVQTPELAQTSMPDHSKEDPQSRLSKATDSFTAAKIRFEAAQAELNEALADVRKMILNRS